MLITSRERLRLTGERDIPVSPLIWPDPERLPTPEQVAAAPAVQLFVERAQAADPGFALNDATAAAVAAICHRLDGLPLALELAAARSPHLPPTAMLTRLARRLPLLTSGPRDVPERLRTMRDAIAWSYDLLSPEEQALFRRLAVFAGGFTTDAAETVCSHRSSTGSVFDGIACLVDKSLARRTDMAVPDGTEPRYELLETIREFGLEQLAAAGEEEHTRTLHIAFFLALAEQATVQGSGESARLIRLEIELPNLRAALTWADGNDPHACLQLAARLGRFWFWSGRHREGRDWLERALANAPGADPALRSSALSACGEVLKELGVTAEAERSYQLARDLSHSCADRAGEATALTGLAMLANDVSDFAARKALIEASLAIWRELGNQVEIARANHNLVWAEAGLGNMATAVGLAKEAVDHARASGDDHWITRAVGNVGDMLVVQGEFGAARPYLEEALAVARSARHQHDVAFLTFSVGMVALELGDIPTARDYLAESLSLLRETGRRRVAIGTLEVCAVLAEFEGHRELAIRLTATSRATRDDIGMPADRDSLWTILLANGRSKVVQTLFRLFDASSTVNPIWSIEDALREASDFVAVSAKGNVAHSVDPDLDPILTPREMDVLRLVVSGDTDQAIADALFISRRTASHHVASILTKLEVATRAEAAVRAVRDRLV